MALTAYRLACKGPIHLGTGREGDLADLDTLPRSDTLAAAIISVWRHVVPGVSQLDVTNLAEQPPFTISSAFPVLEVDQRWEPLIFTPVGIFDRMANVPTSLRKEFKKVRFADTSSIQALLRGRLPDRWSLVGETLLARDPTEELWSSQFRLRLQVDRLGDRPMEGRLYEFGGLHLGDQVRLSVLLDFFDGSCCRDVEAALRLLGDEGIGGDRTVGYGGFEIEHIDENFDPKLGAGARLCLSLLHPSPNEVEQGLLDEPAEYLIAPRGGWATSTAGIGLRRKTVNMLVEGSLIRDLNRSRYGDSPVVLEPGDGFGMDHPVFRPGGAVTIPIETPQRAR
jgi:CRISPR-associated protein Csm4